MEQREPETRQNRSAESGGERSYEVRIEVGAPREAVWRALTDARELCRWFAPSARIDATVGGEVLWQWGEMYRWPQRVELVEPGSRLRTSYPANAVHGQGDARPIFVDFLLEGRGGRTVLRVVQSGFGAEADFDQEYDGTREGWTLELRALRHYLERHLGRERHLVWSHAAVDLPPEAAWERLTGAEGLGCGAELARLAEGEPFAFRSRDGERFAGKALICHEAPAWREFSGVVENLGDSFLWCWARSAGNTCRVWLWLATWRSSREERERLERGFEELFARVFPPTVRSAES